MIMECIGMYAYWSSGRLFKSLRSDGLKLRYVFESMHLLHVHYVLHFFRNVSGFCRKSRSEFG